MGEDVQMVNSIQEMDKNPILFPKCKAQPKTRLRGKHSLIAAIFAPHLMQLQFWINNEMGIVNKKMEWVKLGSIVEEPTKYLH